MPRSAPDKSLTTPSDGALDAGYKAAGDAMHGKAEV